ncbi:immunoglobulin domain protein [Oesophagostomum dentatum]|uniref:Immunoglobulin domain protein n=1 Tax=Oesophagostomum dentatum TaxID=61180 RepID=A0A0B1TB09_OESDE|nr:immunoglobulin domain protein [Oesophagostomum dentatum]
MIKMIRLDYSILYVHVEQGQVARLPCAGLPDVVPGPAEICFVKGDSDFDACLSDKVDSNYLSTATGMQISVVQPHHAGEYYCVVRNEYTKQTRKSPRYVKLRVEQSNNASVSGQPLLPQLVFPSKENRPDNPIVVDAVAGHDIILECVFVRAKIIWTKLDGSPEISLTDDEARLRQVWGNLRIRQVTKDDAGIYCCHGLSPFLEEPSLKEYHLQVYYSLVVHAPTDVHLEMNQNARDKSWQLSCLAKNVRYEIPMVYVNGTPLAEAIGEMGIASSTNFYSNPVNATIRIRSNYSGSVQCISRPAMDEAEIYGVGLERGRSHNMYVVSSLSRDHLIKQGPVNVTAFVGDDVELICLVLQRVNSKYWLKGKSRLLTQRVGSNSLKIHKVEKKDEGWYTCVVIGEGSEKSEQQAYLKVTTRMVTPPPSVPSESYIVKKKDDVVNIEDVRGFVTDSHVRLQWSVIGKMELLTSVTGFKIELRSTLNNNSWVLADNVGSHVRATTIKDLIPNNSKTTNWMHVDDVEQKNLVDESSAKNNDRSLSNGTFFIIFSNHTGGSAFDSDMDFNATEVEDDSILFFKAFKGTPSIKMVAILLSAFLVLTMLLLICCVVWCSIRQSNTTRYLFESTNGKFLDTSYRIFNEQKVHKSRIDQVAVGMDSVRPEECLPLREVSFFF